MNNILIQQAKTEDEVKAVFNLRKEVFVKEQQLYPDHDVDQYDERAIFLIARSSAGIVGTVRVYAEKDDQWVGSRLAVKKGYRGSLAGALLVKEAVRLVKTKNCKRFTAKVQEQNVPFFKRLGWQCEGEAFEYRNIFHQLMKADLGHGGNA